MHCSRGSINVTVHLYHGHEGFIVEAHPTLNGENAHSTVNFHEAILGS